MNRSLHKPNKKAPVGAGVGWGKPKYYHYKEEKRMAIVDWGHLCDYAFFDENKKVCLIGLFTHIRAAHVPTQHPQCAFVFSLSGTPNETVKIKFEVIRPDGKDPLINIENPSLSLTPTGTVTNNFVLENILLPDFGPYEIRIFLNNELAHTTTLHVSRDTR